MTGLLSGGMSGFSLNHSDIGGYTSINYPFVQSFLRSKQLLRRWTEMNAFSVCFRTHEGLGPETNSQVYWSDESVMHFSKWANVFKALTFYRKELVKEASETGLPVVRHPFIHFPSDTNTYNLTYQQFMFGEELMVAPIVDIDANSTEVYLPSGTWVNFWTEEVIESPGQYYIVEDLEDHPAVFHPENSQVAQQFKTNLTNLGIYP